MDIDLDKDREKEAAGQSDLTIPHLIKAIPSLTLTALALPLLQVSLAGDTPPTDKDSGAFHDSDVSDAEGSSEHKDQGASGEAKLTDDEKVSE